MKPMKILIAVRGLLLVALVANPVAAKDDKGKGARELPPGLQKKVARGGALPPGWEKKVEVGKPIEADIYKHHEVVVPVDDKGLVTVTIGGKLLRLREATREVVEILK